MFAALAALLLLAGCGDDKGGDKNGKGPSASPKIPPIVADIALTANEKTSSFDKNAVTSPKEGTIKITVTNPPSNKGQHGVGIDGGVYKNVKGAPVKPGRATSLTVAVKKGKYEIFDSYKDNRSKGYTTTLTVK